jgi:hypothetical protein
MAFNSAADIKAWGDRVPLNPARIPPEYPGSPELDDALSRLQQDMPAGIDRLEQLSEHVSG